LLTDETVDSVLVIQAPQDWFLPASLAEVVGEVAGVHDKPVIASIMGKASVEEALTILHKRKVPNVSFPERAASILSAMIERKEWLEMPHDHAKESIELNLEEAEKSLKQGNWGDLMVSLGISLPPQNYAESLDQAKEQADSIGFPVVMKLVSDEITHKTDVDGVRLNLQDASQVQKAWEEIYAAAERAGAQMQGVLVQKMLIGGQEVILGIKQDEQFGPMVLFGTGGTDVELLKDVKSAVTPLNRREAQQLIEATKAGKKLKGWRNQGPADRQTVIDYLMRLAQLAEEYPEIKELEINPLYVMPAGKGAYALDIRGSMSSQFEKSGITEEV